MIKFEIEFINNIKYIIGSIFYSEEYKFTLVNNCLNFMDEHLMNENLIKYLSKEVLEQLLINNII